jgi:hypothetical protein
MAIRIDDVFAILRNTMVPAKYRLASEETMVEISGMITIGAMRNGVITETHEAPTDKIIDPGFRGHTMCNPKIF